MAKRDISKPTYYIDSCVFIDLIELPPTDERARIIAQVITDAEDEKCNLVTSILTIAEVVYSKHEIDKKTLDPIIEEKIDKLWHPASSPIQLVDVHELIVRDARKWLREGVTRGWTKTRGIDAIHLATAHREFVDEFFTNERAMEKWGLVMGFAVRCPHTLAQETQGEQLFDRPPTPEKL